MNEKVKEILKEAIKNFGGFDDFGFFGGKYCFPESDKEFQETLSHFECLRDDLNFMLSQVKKWSDVKNEFES